MYEIYTSIHKLKIVSSVRILLPIAIAFIFLQLFYSKSNDQNVHHSRLDDDNIQNTYSLAVGKKSINDSSLSNAVSKQSGVSYANTVNGLANAGARRNINNKSTFLYADSLLQDEDNFNDLPPLHGDMVNVTLNRFAYRIKGINGSAAVLALAVDKQKIPSGYDVNHVFPYYYDRIRKEWQQLKRDSIDLQKAVIYSVAYKDGDYINAVVQAPDAPETQGYMPTTMSDIKAADPASMVQIIQPPVINNQGSANLNYHIEIPKGRNGIEPNLNITYNSEGGNSWLGEGWDLSGISSIKVDTRWGVPAYDANFETETYLLDGQMLAFMDNSENATEAHRNFDANGILKHVQRQPVVEFYPRKEKNFEHITRNGAEPGNCSWIITDRKGTKYFYGLSDASRLSVSGKIAEWKIDSVIDVFGNSMKYEYGHDDYLIKNSSEKSYNIYLKNIFYTRLKRPGAPVDPNYRIEFISNDHTNNLFVNGRYGFFTGNRRWLDSIKIIYTNQIAQNGPTDHRVREYVFKSKTWAFNKTVLKSIIQIGRLGNEFNDHEFTYYNNVSDGNLFNGSKVIDNNNGSSPIGTVSSNSNSGNFYVGIGGNDWQLWQKSLTFGLHGGFSGASSQSAVSLIDIDGDGLPDKVFSNSGSLKYQKGTGAGFVAGLRNISANVTNFFEERSNSFNIGGEVNAGAFAGVDYSKTNNTTSTYFSDANADGLIDIISGGRVHFNEIIAGVPTFTTDSRNTYVPIGSGSFQNLFTAGTTTVNSEIKKVEDRKKELNEHNPLNDVVRVWEAPFDGFIKITAPVTQKAITVSSLSELQKVQFQKADGLRVSIQIEDGGAGRQDSHTFIANDPNPVYMFPNLPSGYYHIGKGKRIYFRVQSGDCNSNSCYANGAFDQVIWEPEITYQQYSAAGDNDVFNKNKLRYNAAEDFFVGRVQNGVTMPKKGKLHITTKLIKKITNDSVSLEILKIRKDGTNTYKIKNPTDSLLAQLCDSSKPGAFKTKFSGIPDSVFVCNCDTFKNCRLVKHPNDSIWVTRPSRYDTLYIGNYSTGATTDIFDTEVPVDSADVFQFNIHSAANIDLSAVEWKPRIQFKDEQDSLFPKEYIVPNYEFNNSIVQEGTRFLLPGVQDYVISPYLKFRDSLNTTGQLILAIRNNNSVLKRVNINVKDGVVEGIDTLKLHVSSPAVAGNIFASYENPATFSDTINNPVYKKLIETSITVYNTDSITAQLDSQGGNAWSCPKDGKYIFRPKLIFNNNYNGFINYRIDINNINWKSDTLFFSFEKENKNRYDTFSLKQGDRLTINFAKFQVAGMPYVYLPASAVQSGQLYISQVIAADLWNKNDDFKFGQMYRGWGQFIYNGGYSGYDNKIKQAALVLSSVTPDQNLSNNVSNSVNNQVASQSTTGMPDVSTMDGFSPLKNALCSLHPFADSLGNLYWIGNDSAVYIGRDTSSSSRFGIKDISVQSPFLDVNNTPRTVGNFEGIGVDKNSNSESWSFNVGAGPLSGTYARGNSEIESDFMDLNGDRFPDIMMSSNNIVQVTQPNGKLDGVWGTNIKHHSSTRTIGGGFGGSFPTASPIMGGSNNKKGGSVGAVLSNLVNEVFSGEKKAEDNVGFSLSAATGTDDVQATWMDVNGDGLTDKLVKKGSSVQVYLNIGKSFGAHDADIFRGPFDFGFSSITESKNENIDFGPSAGININNNSIKIGMGRSATKSKPINLIQDLNGDGWPDQLMLNGSNLTVDCNDGWIVNNSLHFSNSLNENGNFNSSTGQAFSANYTYGIPIPVCFFYPCIKLSIGGGGSHSNGTSQSRIQLLDMDGDGFPDVVSSSDDNKLSVAYSKIAGTNKLETVTNPLGGKFTIKYDHTKPELEHPGGKWVMSKLTMDDGIAEDGPNQIDSFTYTGGKYDRYEREFLGFSRIATCNMDKEKVYRQHIQIYDTANYYVANNLTGQWMEDKDGNKFSETTTTYYLKKVFPKDGSTGHYNMQPTDNLQVKFFNGICFSAAMLIKKGNHEGVNQKFSGNYSLIRYNALGNITDYYYSDKDPVTDARYTYHTDITYKLFDATNKIFGLDSVVVTDTGSIGSEVRKTFADYNSSGQLTSIRKLLNSDSSGEHYNITSFTYDNIGNITGKTMPSNAQGRSVQYQYKYDPETHIYINKIIQLSDAATTNPELGFNFYSEIETDKRFGMAVKTIDIHGSKIISHLDEFGRIDTILGPNESFNSTGYSLAFAYPIFRNTVGLSALTTHFDERNPGIQTVNFIDGFNRSVQVKKTAVYENDATQKWTVSGKNYYDAFGRVIKAYQPTLDKSINGIPLLLNQARDSNAIETKFDIMDRAVEIRLQDGSLYSKTDYSVDGDLVVQTDILTNPSGNQQKRIYTNGADLKVRESYNGVNTDYYYDRIHQLKQVNDYANRAVFNYVYDYAGRKIQTTGLDAGTNYFSYDNAGNLIKKVNAKGEVTEYIYDFNRLVQVHYPNEQINDVKYVYGTHSSAPGSKETANRVIFHEDASGGQSYTYDELGNIKENIRTIISPFDDSVYTFKTGYVYDTWNRIKSITYPDNDVVNYIYNNAGLLDRIIQKHTGVANDEIIVDHIGYDQFEQKVLIRYGTNNKIETKYVYESKRRRPDTVKVSRNNVNITRTVFGYDNLDNTTNIQINNSSSVNLAPNISLNNTYGYDSFNRLTFSANIWDTTGTVNDISNKLTLTYNDDFSVKTRIANYSAQQGNITRQADEQFNYGPGHRLKQVHRNALSQQKNYKGDGDPRNLVYTDNTTEKYSYDQKGNDTLRLTSEQYGNNLVSNTNSRKILWDAENRIKAIDLDGLVSAYIYDADGNRTIKISTRSAGIYINGKKAGDTTLSASFNLYAGPYFSMRNGDGVFTKHIYMGSERISSQLENYSYFTNGSQGDGGINPRLPGFVATCNTANNNDCPAFTSAKYIQKAIITGKMINGYFAAFDLPFHPLPEGSFVKKPVVPVLLAASNYFRCFFHNDRVNSVSIVSDDAGNIIQYAAYLPFGETFVSRSSNYNSQFTFNGKEQDQESGLYYYGARYYDPHTYQWLGVDPMAEKYAFRSPFIFSGNNPVSLIDRNGAEEVENDFIGPLKQTDWRVSDRNNNTQTWDAANRYNIQQSDGYNQYKSIGERSDFYSWYQEKSNAKGNETRWAGGAASVASAINLMSTLDPFLSKFANAGNKEIFNDVFNKLGDALNGPALTGSSAKTWDINLLTHEQNLVQHLYNGLTSFQYAQVNLFSKTPQSILPPLVQALLIYQNAYLPPFPLFGNIKDPVQRIRYGTTLMGY